MLRIILGIVVGVVTCAMLVIVGGLIIRESWPEYAAVEGAMTFTQPMLFTRLALSSIALLIAAWVTTLIVRKSVAALILGIVLLLVSIPIHINLWDKFPVWYHLTFLATLIPLCILGGRIVRSAGRMEQTKTTVILLALLAFTMPAWRAHAQAPPQTKNDYSKAETWLCRPGRQDACAADLTTTIVAANGKLTEEKWKANPNAPIDCFYVYPTVSNDPTPNSDMTAGPEERSVVQHQFARFGSQCRPYAPLYRQITLTALRANLSGRPVTTDRALGYNDVLDAWKYYLEHDNQGRGVVLIGHSQGSSVLIQLIKNEIDGKPIQDRVVSALLLGMNVAVPKGKDVGGAFQKMPLCRASNQTGCVISYVTFRENLPPPANSIFGRAPGEGMVAACTNPAALDGGSGELHAYLAAGRSANTSSAAPKPWSTPEQLIKTPFVSVPGLLSAECVSNEKGSYLALKVHGDPADPRTDDIVGDVVVNGQVQANWGLHLIDVQAAMGNLVNIVGQQAKAYQAKKKK